MGDFVDDAIYGALNTDADPTNDVDMFFNNAGGIRIDWCDKADPVDPAAYIWTSTAADCSSEGIWAHDPMLLTYGMMFTILPFGNATAVGDHDRRADLRPAQPVGHPVQGRDPAVRHPVQVLPLQRRPARPAALRLGRLRRRGVRQGDRTRGSRWTWTKTYRVGTNEFLAPAGQDGLPPFKYMKNITYWGDMLERGQRLRVGATTPAPTRTRAPTVTARWTAASPATATATTPTRRARSCR